MQLSILLYLLLTANLVFSQRSLTVSTQQTTALAFPYPIITADRGSQTILLKKAKGVEHVLLLKAAKTNFETTNVTVVTKDGSVYSFVVGYHPKPDTLFFDFRNLYSQSPHPTPPPQAIQRNLQWVSNSTEKNLRKFRSRHQMTLTLEHIYTQDAHLYFAFRLTNASALDYYCSAFNLLIKDKRQRKRTARQAIPVRIVDSYQSPDLVKGNSHTQFIVAVPLFTIPDKKKLVVQLMERNGGRHLSLPLRNTTLLRARLLSPEP